MKYWILHSVILYENWKMSNYFWSAINLVAVLLILIKHNPKDPFQALSPILMI